MIKKLVYALTLCLVACTGATDSKPTLSVSIEPQRKILQELAGDNFDVVTVMAKGSNPETYDPSVSQRMAVDKSQAYFIIGYLPFEQSIADGCKTTHVVNTSAGIDQVLGTHSHGEHQHAEEADPHTWTSIRNVKIIARNMVDELIKLDPDNQDAYMQRYSAMVQRLDSLDGVVSNHLADAGVHAFVVWHPSLSYYARDYGLHQIAVGQESKEQSVGNLSQIIEEAREDSVQVFFFQREYDSRQAESLNREIGSRLVTIDPLAYDWEDEIIKITYELAK